MKKHSAKKSWFTSSGYLSKRGETFSTIETFVKWLSWIVRVIPINRKKAGLFIKLSVILKKYRFTFTFRCRRLGILWSASAFPDLLTRSMMFGGMYQEDVLIALRNLVKPGDVVFDVGGHHGLMAIVSALATGSLGKVITFEPNPSARIYLDEHLKLNNISNVIVEPIALSDNIGKTPFYVQSGMVTWNSSLIREFADPHKKIASITVKTTTLDNYVLHSGLIPKIIKIDTEGSEFKILNGAKETIRTHKPILIIEFNPKSALCAQTSISHVVSNLKREGYKLFVLERNLLGYFKFNNQRVFEENIHCTGSVLRNVICYPQNYM